MRIPPRSTGLWMLSAIVVLGFNLSAAPLRALAGEPPPEWDGLIRVPDKGADHLYLLRGADFSNYTSVQIAPVQVAFDANWNRNTRQRNPARFVTDSDMEQIRSMLSDEFHQIFDMQLRQAGWRINAADGPQILRITPAIVNLTISAPNTQRAGRGRTYVTSTGQMTLVLELRDSVTGQLLGRVVDTMHGRAPGGRFTLATPVTNLADARAALTNWSRMTIAALNYAKSSSPPGTALAEKPNPNESGQPR